MRKDGSSTQGGLQRASLVALKCSDAQRLVADLDRYSDDDSLLTVRCVTAALLFTSLLVFVASLLNTSGQLRSFVSLQRERIDPPTLTNDVTSYIIICN